MEEGIRMRIALASCAALVAMGGVVGFALAHKSAADDSLPGGKNAVHRRVDPPDEMPAGCEPDAQNPGTIVFDLPAGVLDLGSQKQGVIVERDVKFRNAGTGTLCVTRAKTGCGCVKAEVVGAPLKLAPNETGVIHIRADTTGKEGSQPKDVDVYTNDPAHRVAQFRVTLDVRLGVIASTSFLSFNRHIKGQPATATLRLKSPKDDAAWKVTDVVNTDPAGAKFTFTANDVEPEDKLFHDVDVVITHPGSMEIGGHSDTMKVLTSHPDRPEIQVRSQLQVVDKVFAAPPSVPFGLARQDLVTAPFHVRIIAGEPGQQIKVLSAKIDGQGFLAGEPAPASLGEWDIEVRADTHGLPPGRATAELVVTVDDPEVKEIRVKLRVEVQGPPAAPSDPKGK